MLGLDVHRVTRVAMLADAVAVHRVGYAQLCGIVQRYGATSAGARCAIAGATTWPGWELGSWTTCQPRPAEVEPWEQWVATRARPVERVMRGAKVTSRDGLRWISYRDERDGQRVIVEMPSNALTKSCTQDRHDDCEQRVGGRHEGGVVLKLTLPGFTWRCGCACHNDPIRAGRLF